MPFVERLAPKDVSGHAIKPCVLFQAHRKSMGDYRVAAEKLKQVPLEELKPSLKSSAEQRMRQRRNFSRQYLVGQSLGLSASLADPTRDAHSRWSVLGMCMYAVGHLFPVWLPTPMSMSMFPCFHVVWRVYV